MWPPKIPGPYDCPRILNKQILQYFKADHYVLFGEKEGQSHYISEDTSLSYDTNTQVIEQS